MKEYVADAILGLGGRDEYFQQILKRFTPSPLNILQIGAIEEPKRAWRHFSGWSDIFFASYISVFGGKLDVVDFNEDHLENSRKVLDDFDIEFELHLSEASEFLSNNKAKYDLVYLDAGNCPNETKKQYDLLDRDQIPVIIIDDHLVKGTEIEYDKSHTKEILEFLGSHFVEAATGDGKNSMALYINFEAYDGQLYNKGGNGRNYKFRMDETLL